MDSEDLTISAEEVRVDYVYTNHASEDREVVIAFPLPALPEADEYYEYYMFPDWDSLDFATTVDGQPIDYVVEDRALVGTRDITAQLESEGLPVHWYAREDYLSEIQLLPEAEKRRLVAAGLLTLEDEETLFVRPSWRAQRHYLRTEVFPAGASVRVSHRYTPLIGGSVGGVLYPGFRNESYGREALAEYRRHWCIDDAFLAGVDRKLAAGNGGDGEDGQVQMSETWLGYVLSSGANWRGPIGRFRLVVDKGSPDNLVSFCMDGVRKISPTQFEVVKEDYEPEGDLDILIATFHRFED